MRLNTQCPLKLLFSLEECQNAILWFPIEILNTFVFYCVQLSLKLAELLQVFCLRKFPRCENDAKQFFNSIHKPKQKFISNAVVTC